MEGTLIVSSNTRGRYAVDDGDGCEAELSSGQPIAVKLGGQWIPGRIEYNHDQIYATLGPQTLGEVAQMATRPRAIGGYYFTAKGGGICGLCVGMEVRVE